MRQIGLPFPYDQVFHAADFLAGDCNTAVLAWLDDPFAWPGLRLAVHGGIGSGKTHVLHVFAERMNAVLLPGVAVRGLPDLAGAGAVAVDDADAGPDPVALLHLLNMAAELRLPVLLTGRSPPMHWAYTLPDLTSRLRAMPVEGLRYPDDALLQALLARLLADRQLAVAPAVQAFIRQRIPRTGDALREVAARLDRASLALGGKVTRAVAAGVVADMGCEEIATDAPVGSIEEGLPF
jgi:chromosomal replication initiation ATPase DnaA